MKIERRRARDKKKQIVSIFFNKKAKGKTRRRNSRTQVTKKTKETLF